MPVPPAEDARYQALLAGMLDPVVTIDEFGIIQDASLSVERVFGYRSDELVGRNIKVLMPEPHRSLHDDYLARYRASGETWILNTTREFEIVRKDGERISCELSVSRVDLPGDRSPTFCGSFRDVTDRKQAEDAARESDRRLRAVFDQEFQFVGLLKPDGTVLEVNRAALEAAGLRHEEAIGLPFWHTRWWGDSEAEGDRIRDAVRRAARGEFVRYQTKFTSRAGKTRAIDFSLKPVRDDDGNVTLLIPEGRDITEIQRAQERETAMLRALASIGESAAVLAHEIKNPITAVNLALRAVADQLGEDQSVILEDLVSRMRHLESVMRRTLSFAKPLELRRAAVDPAGIAEKACNALRQECASHDIRLELVRPSEETRLVELDDDLLEEVLINLVKNAIEAQESGGRIVVRVEDRGDSVRYVVSDDGPGMPPSALDTLFRPFSTTKATGTGLGLAICRKIVEDHGGSIEHVTPGELRGATFVVELPVRGDGRTGGSELTSR